MAHRITIGFIGFLTYLMSGVAYSQERVITAGLQFKPIIPYSLVGTGKRTLRNDTVNFNVAPQLGYAFGMVARWGISKTISLESGINYVARNYSLKFNRKDEANYSTKMLFAGYEIPISILMFIRLGKKLYMNASMGSSFDFYPTGGIVSNINGYEFAIVESKWIQTAVIANLGLEYRTEKSGYIYFGASFHRPFTKTADIFLSKRIGNNFNRLIEDELSGNYLTVDLRYFFHENPQNKK